MSKIKVSFPVQCPRWAYFSDYLERLGFSNPDIDVTYHKNTGIILEDYYVRLVGEAKRISEITKIISQDIKRFNGD